MYIIKTPVHDKVLYYQRHYTNTHGEDIVALTPDINLAAAFSSEREILGFDIYGEFSPIPEVIEEEFFISDYIVEKGREYGLKGYQPSVIAELLGWKYIKINRMTTIEEE
ncbi:MAG: hypothetical protein ACRCXX_05925 [Cetobacterium sp.]|uniref:hypothetical protein n=1 Tax=Cetobacterium sp. TaxID=2071632 RepID=UPI003F3EA116